MEMQVNVEIIDGNKYYTAVDAKGNSTMVLFGMVKCTSKQTTRQHVALKM